MIRCPRLPAMPPADSLRPAIAALSIAVACLAWAGPQALRDAHAQAPAAPSARSYGIPAGPLAGALAQFSSESGVFVVGASELARGRTSPGLSGSYLPVDALRRLLAGSGLDAAPQADGSYVLRADGGVAVPGESASAAGSTLPVVVVTAAAEAETATGPVAGYKAERSATATRIDVPLQDQPVSVKVIPAELIDDLGVRNVTEVADYVAGVARETVGYSPFGQSYYIRGFSTYGAASTVNGFRLDGFLGATDLAAIERVEFLKGPAAVLYGASSAISGIANTVTKRPQPGRFATIEATAGQFGFGRVTLDANGPVGSGDAVQARVNVAAEGNDGFRAYPGSHTNTLLAVTPIITAQLSPDTRAELELSAARGRYNGRCDGVYPDPVLLSLSIRKQVVCDDLAHASLDTFTARAEVTHRFDAQWSLRVAGFFGRSNSERIEQYPVEYDNPIGPDGRTIDRYTQRVTSYSRNSAGQLELRGDLTIGPLRHRLLIGTEATRYYSPFTFFSAPATPFDIVFTRYDGQQLAPFEANGPTGFSRANARALYVQDFIEIGEHWKVLAGVRRDTVRSTSGELTGDPADMQRQSESANSPRLGVVFEPVRGTALYASWARSFSPNVGARDVNGNIFAAERGTQYEFGVKQELLDRRLNVTASIFNLERSNVLTADPSDPTGTYSIATGKQRSRGFELDVVGRITPAWSVTGAYTYLDAKVTEDNSIPIGSGLVGAARNSGAVWNKVSLGAWQLPEWSVGLGIVASGDRQARLPNIPVTLGSYTRLDAGLYYVRGPMKLQVNLANLTNRRIFVGQGSLLYPQSPRALTVSAAYTF